MTCIDALARFRRLLHSTSGVAATEFAMTLPFLLGLGLTGLEVANRAMVQMKISQLAVHVADNASRIGDTSTIDNRKIYEADLNDLFYGAHIQAGDDIDVFEHGRVIISSLEVVPGTEDQQYIHWQRCMGAKNHTSTYGLEGDGLDQAFPGMGPVGEEVTAFPDDAVIFVEISYDYQPLIGNPFAFESTVQASASFTVRDDRDLAQIYQQSPASPDPVADCSSYNATGYAAG